MMKTKRIVNKPLLEQYHTFPCSVCHSHGTTVAHHIKSRGAGGDDVEENLIPLCHVHHSEIHQIGRRSMLNKYPWLSEYLEDDYGKSSKRL